MNRELIRNFSIIAHIDHGKSTLADRLLELTGTLSEREMTEQVLDDMELERERGITIKSHAVRMHYENEGNDYILNLIDTPGHVDFTYEVSRALAACEGVLLVVDASQGVEAQTVANLYLALEHDLSVIPLLNKIDLPGANVERVRDEVVDLIGCDPEDILAVSAKEGTGVPGVLEAIVKRVPPPMGDPNGKLQALIFDSEYDQYRGVVAYVRLMSGTVRRGQQALFCAAGADHEVDEVGTLRLSHVPAQSLSAGEVGYVIANVRTVADTRVGDTITLASDPAPPLPGYRESKPMVYAGIYPTDSDGYTALKTALEKLQLNDASLVFEPEASQALGFGFRCGFLGLLHMEIVTERLAREYDLDIIATVPQVEYVVHTTNGNRIQVDSPARLPAAMEIETFEEPFVHAQIITPPEHIGALMKLALDRRGSYRTTQYLDSGRVTLHFDMPLSEIIFDFYDRLKSLSRGYASLDYEVTGLRSLQLVKLDILINGESVDALSVIVHTDSAQTWGTKLCRKLKELIPRQLFEVVIQGAVGSRVISRSTVKALRKNVTAKCYGGDVTRKRKLLEKQREGKRRMKQLGSVDIPQDAFLAVLRVER